MKNIWVLGAGGFGKLYERVACRQKKIVQRSLIDLEHHGFLECTHRRRLSGSLTSDLYRAK